MKRKAGVRELELEAASVAPPKTVSPRPSGEAMAMLARRGFRPVRSVGDVPFPPRLDAETADRFCCWLDHYAFRLFLRGAIQKPEGFFPVETTRYLSKSKSEEYAGHLVSLGLAEKGPGGKYKLKWPARSFGSTLEWYDGRGIGARLRGQGERVSVGPCPKGRSDGYGARKGGVA
jgi:hypothetical protein